MAANTLGYNQEFQIYNADGTAFNNLVLRKSVVDSIVMSLGDKITGDVFYKDNTLQVTMKEYVVYNGIHYSLVNPPTIVREGMVADNGELKGMTKYSFEFYHPMYQLGNIPFCDVAVSTDQTRYLSENKTFSWIGKPQDFIDKLNKNLQGTQWIVEKSTAFPAEKGDELSDVLTFDKNMISDALKTFHDTWDVPYVVDVVDSSESSYASGKRFKVVIGLPVKEIYASESDRQLGTPFVFRMGQGVGLKNNSRNPRNNKIITRLAGYGSEKNIPYGYPQIVWDGADDDPRLRYSLYDGIVGGRYVKLIQHPFTRNHLMPSVYTDAVNKKVNPNATGYNPDIELKDYYDAVGGDYPNQINPLAPSYEIHEFDDIKPEMDDGTSNVEILGAIPLNADLTPASEWVDDIDGDGNFVQSFFQITLPQLSFDIYACAAITQEMQINMRSGDCIGCTFPIQVDWDDYKRNFYDENGDFAPDGSQRDLSKYPKSNLGSINVIVQKENSTFGTIMPSKYQQPQSGDEFVILGISLPVEYITSAEQRLDEAMQSFLLENNVYYYDYPLKFDEHFLATHTYILSQIKPNAILRFQYAGQVLGLYVKQLTIKYGTAVLPEYDITLTDNVDVVLNQIGQVADDVEKLSSIISILRQSYNRNVWVELAKKLSKVSDDTAQGFIRFIQGLQVGNQFVTGLLGEGGVFRKEADGTTYLEADKMYIRIKAYFDNVEIRDYKHSAGNRIASPAGAKCCRVEYIDSNGNVTTNVANAVKFRCYFRGSDGEDEVRNNFVVGDQAYCHITSVDTKDDDPNSKSLNMKHYWRLIVGRNATNVLTENGEHWIDLSNRASETLTIDGTTYTHAGYQSGSDVPAAQDDIIQLGNINDTDRMGAIIEFVTGADAPSYQIFQGINDFNLNGKNYIGLGYSTQTGRAYLNVYGDAYIGDKPDQQGNARSYLKYNAANRQLSIKARIDASSTIDGTEIDEYIAQHSSDWTEEEINSLIHDVTDDIQAQIDGAIDTWFYNGTPSDRVLPESEWKAIDIAAGNNNERLKHLGDIYYDNETGYAYRYSNTGTESSPVFVWNPITDSAVVEALERAAKAQDTADGKRTIYGVWNAWIKDGSNILEVGDLFIPQSTTTQGGVTYTANKVYKCTVKGSPTFQEVAYTDDSAFNGYINAILNGSGSSGNAAVVAAAQKAIKEALGNGTIVDGGLVLTSLIAMRDSNNAVWSGINGQYQANETGTGYKGHGIAAWYGGGMIDHEVNTSATGYAKSLFRFDGSGYLAGGNVSWDKNGIVTIANVYSNVNGQNIEWSGTTLQYMNNLSNSLPLTYQSGTAYFDPKISFTNLSVMGKTVATQEWVGQNYISIAFFNRLFRAYNGETLVNPNDTTTTINNIKAMFGFWTEQYISALGKGDSGSGGGVGDVTWELLANNSDTRQIALSHLTTALSGYATQSWVYQQLTGGTVTAVKVGTTTYNPTSGVVSLPAYPSVPTKVSQLTNDSGFITSSALSGYALTSQLSNYLPLTGGTMANTNKVTNLNADKIDGFDAGLSGNQQISAKSFTTVVGNNNSYYKIGSLPTISGTGTGESFVIIHAYNLINFGGNKPAEWVITASSRDNYSVVGVKLIGANQIKVGYVINNDRMEIWICSTTVYFGKSAFEVVNANNFEFDFLQQNNAPSGFVEGNIETAAYLTSNVASATKLQTPRTIWGQNFDGTANVSGALTGVGNITSNVSANTDWGIYKLTEPIFRVASAGLVISPYDKSEGFVAIRTGTNTVTTGEKEIRLLSDGKVGIGTKSPAYKLDVEGTLGVNGVATIQNYIDIDRTDYGSLPLGEQIPILRARSKNAKTGTYGYNIVISTFGSGETGTTVNNFPVRLGSQTGATWISAGESGKMLSSVYTDMCNTKKLLLTSDNAIEFFSGLANNSSNYESRKILTINSSGLVIPSGKTLTIGDAVLSWDSTNQGIKITKGLYSETFISALGAGSGGSGGGGVGDVTWELLANNSDTRQIALSHLTTALSGYATQSWVYQQLTGGTVTAVKVGTTTYNPTSGVVSLPAYPSVPTKVSQLTNDAGYTTNIGTVTQVKVGTTAYNPSSGVVSLPAYPSVPTKTSQLTNDSGFITSSASITGNAGSATKLHTARTIWGQNFDGTADVDGKMTINYAGSSAAELITLKTTNSSYNCINYANVNSDGNSWSVGINKSSYYLWNSSKGTVFSVLNNGNVGIGTTSPSYKLHVAGTFYASGNGTLGGDLTINGGDLMINEPNASSASSIRFQSGGTTYGNLRVKPSNGEFYFYNGTNGDGQSSVCVNAGEFYAYGQVTALSDVRDKNVMGDVSLNVEQIANAPAIRFMWKDGRDDKSMQAGSIAQYWHKVLPEVIREKDDRLSLNYSVAALVSSIIIARKVVDHERRIAELERENKELKMKLKIA